MDFLTPELLAQAQQNTYQTVILLLAVVVVLVAVGGLSFIRLVSQQQRRVLSLAERQQTHLEGYDPRLDAMNDNLRSGAELTRALAANIAALTESLKASGANVTARLSMLEGSVTDLAAQEAEALKLLPALRDKTNALQVSLDGLPGRLKSEISGALQGILDELKTVREQISSAKHPCTALEQLQQDVRALMLRLEAAASVDEDEDTVELKSIGANA